MYNDMNIPTEYDNYTLTETPEVLTDEMIKLREELHRTFFQRMRERKDKYIEEMAAQSQKELSPPLSGRWHGEAVTDEVLHLAESVRLDS